MGKPKLVVIGNGMAGMRTVEELLKLAPDLYDITVFGEEPHPNYNRILLSPVLTGEQTLDQIILNPLDWYAQHGIRLHTGDPVVHIDRARRVVVSRSGIEASYDRLLMATGSRPVRLPLPGAELAGVVCFRDIADVQAMVAAAREYRQAVVIGGGLLGLEAANGLRARGMQVTVVHLASWLMERQLDEPAARLLQRTLEERGIAFRLAAQTEALQAGESGRVCAVRLKGGEVLPAGLVVMAVGIRPNTQLAEAAGLHCNRGIVVDDTLQTVTDPRIYAVGECASHRGVFYGLVAPLFEQAKVAANHLARFGIARYTGSITATKLKVTGVDLYSAGDFMGGEGCEEIVLRDAGRGVYKKLVLRQGRIVGACLYGDTLDGPWYFELMREGSDVTALRERLMFGRAHVGDAGHGDPRARVQQLPDSAEICGCNGVCKGKILAAIRDQKLFTLEEVRAHTKASASCGSCTGLVEALLAMAVGGDHSTAPSKKPLCPCTHYTHDEVRAAIRDQGLKSIPAVMRRLEWKTPDGCPKCRPALNYYLLAAWPGEYADDAQSRFINERAHGNIQKDGSFSVVPRIWGGVVSPRELRAIAAVAEKYQAAEVKITGGQRIDLFGIRKEDLPAVWRDLSAAGFVSGHAYGKALRTVKTCVGSRWCRFGTQDSTGLGIKLEQATWGSWMPHKFKMAVSGCPRNCAEATIKDFGVVCVDSGYELHVGGNGGIKVRVTDLLTHVKTEAEVIEHACAFIQLYREEAHYLERTAPWVERVGLAHIKARVVEDADSRRALYERFLQSQRHAQRDPWAERAQGGAAHEFAPLETVV
ncbi:MAG: nitrite reductase large subunit NirB [Thiobacillaceae bacterium]|nr:nitrite reductase large subunit NirB [Thiobacillaceae bacterium]